MTEPEPTDLTNCDREPIHIPGSVQSHGCLIACDARAVTILRHSMNCAEILGTEIFGLQSDINGASLDTVFGGQLAHTLRNALSTSTVARPTLLLGVAVGGRSFDIAIHRMKSTTIVEFEPVGETAQSESREPLQLARQMIGRISDIRDIPHLKSAAARLIRVMFGYDRVMIYEFEEDGSGKVVTEAKRTDLEGFLGQYFPASDIPQQARRLYLENTIRIIADVNGARIPLQPVLDAEGEALDLSHAHLRSVSPIHCEYLRNMGVAASMSISVIVEGKLWGLIACHHYSPHKLAMAERIAAEMFGEFFSLNLELLEQKHGLDAIALARGIIDGIVQAATHQSDTVRGDLGEMLRNRLDDFSQLLECDGVGLWVGDRWTAQGSAPPQAAVPALLGFLGSVTQGRTWATHALSEHMPAAATFADAVSGVLAIPLSQRPRDYVLLFRKEVVETLQWAGNPDKTYESGPLGDRLTPRQSFAIWKQTVEKQAQPWSASDRRIGEAAHTALVGIVLRYNELLADERSKFDVRQRMLNEELNHRVKNILAIIKSLVGYPVETGRDLGDYVASLQGRIQALAFAHDQIVRGDGGGKLFDLLEAELTPYRGSSSTVELDGEQVWLDARAFSVMALVLHELSTNAAKYGALSVVGGSLSVAWTIDDEDACRLTWRESGGPIVTPPKRHGFGSVLIDRSVPFELDGSSSVDYAASGVVAEFIIPKRHFSVDRMPREAKPQIRRPVNDVRRLPRSDVHLLLVEDQMLIAMDAEAMLTKLGIASVLTCRTASEASAALGNITPDVAILDVNLGVGTSIPVAELLGKLAIPFMFATGYDDLSMVPYELRDVPVIRKPYDIDELHTALSAALRLTVS